MKYRVWHRFPVSPHPARHYYPLTQSRSLSSFFKRFQAAQAGASINGGSDNSQGCDKWNLQEHRAMVSSEKERMSIATFYGLNLDGVMGQTATLVNPQRPALFKTIGVGEFFKAFLSAKLNGKSHLDIIRIQNG